MAASTLFFGAFGNAVAANHNNGNETLDTVTLSITADTLLDDGSH